jgi:hypothetical protein
MKKTRRSPDELLPGYDFFAMKGGVRGKYASQYREGSNVVLLHPEIAKAFPTEDAVNEALRGVLNTMRTVRSKGGLRNETLVPAGPRTKRSRY